MSFFPLLFHYHHYYYYNRYYDYWKKDFNLVINLGKWIRSKVTIHRAAKKLISEMHWSTGRKKPGSRLRARVCIVTFASRQKKYRKISNDFNIHDWRPTALQWFSVPTVSVETGSVGGPRDIVYSWSHVYQFIFRKAQKTPSASDRRRHSRMSRMLGVTSSASVAQIEK